MNTYEDPQIAQQRALAQALMSRGMNPQAVNGQYRRTNQAADLVSALTGAVGMYKADQRQRADDEAYRKTIADALAGPQAPVDGVGPVEDQNEYLVKTLAGNRRTAPMALDYALKQRMGGAEAPSDVQVYEYWKRLSPEERENFSKTQRAPRWLDTGGQFQQAPTFPGSPPGASPPPIPKNLDPKDQPDNAAAKAAAEAAARAAAEKDATVASKAPALANLNYLDQQFRIIQGETSTGGPLGAKGVASRALDYQNTQRFNNIREQISTELRTIFRIPGEGTLSDREQAQYGMQLPYIKNDPAVNLQIMEDIKTRSANRLRQGDATEGGGNVRDWNSLK